jgi:hypothetical protein
VGQNDDNTEGIFPIFVVGSDVPGQPPSNAEFVMGIGGFDGTNTQRISTDTAGHTIAVGSLPDGGSVASTSNPVMVAAWDGEVVHTVLYCPHSAAISTSSSGLTQIVAASSGLSIYICNVSLSNAAGVNIQFVQGTMVSTPCDTGTSNLTGNFQNVATASLFAPTNPITTGAGNSLCINLGASVDVEGVVSYAQF